MMTPGPMFRLGSIISLRIVSSGCKVIGPLVLAKLDLALSHLLSNSFAIIAVSCLTSFFCLSVPLAVVSIS